MGKIPYIIIGLLLLLIFPQCKKGKVGNPCYAIGVIDFYNTRHIYHWSGAEINYTFFVNGKEYHNQYKNREDGKEWKIPSYGNYKKDDKYMVQYNESDPGSSYTCSRMLFDYQVKDSSDYKKYIDEFKNNPPK
jgi:hypothetical protein